MQFYETIRLMAFEVPDFAKLAPQTHDSEVSITCLPEICAASRPNLAINNLADKYIVEQPTIFCLIELLKYYRPIKDSVLSHCSIFISINDRLET